MDRRGYALTSEKKLNDVTIKNKYPLPNIEDLLDRTRGSKVFCVLDMSSAYWQIPLAPEDRCKTAFSTMNGHFEFNVMPFGLTNAPATQQEAMQNVLSGLENVDVLLDDIIIHGSSVQMCMKNLKRVFQRFREFNLRLKRKKCHFMKPTIEYLGYVISGEGKSVDPRKKESIVKYPVPSNAKELRSFLGIASFCRRFIRDFAIVAQPLYDLTRPRKKFEWTFACQVAFEEVKKRLMSAPVLAMPNPNLPYMLYTDASDLGMGAVLCQQQGGKRRIIAYASKHFNDREKRLYAIIEKEANAVVWALEHFQVYLKGARFRIVSDHAPLKWLWCKVGASGRLGRWQLKLLEYFDGLVGVEFLKGSMNTAADGLSRMPKVMLVDVDEFGKKQEQDSDFPNMKGLVKDACGIWRWRGRCFVPIEFRKQLIRYFHDKGLFKKMVCSRSKPPSKMVW